MFDQYEVLLIVRAIEFIVSLVSPAEYAHFAFPTSRIEHECCSSNMSVLEYVPMFSITADRSSTKYIVSLQTSPHSSVAITF